VCTPAGSGDNGDDGAVSCVRASSSLIHFTKVRFYNSILATRIFIVCMHMSLYKIFSSLKGNVNGLFSMLYSEGSI